MRVTCIAFAAIAASFLFLTLPVQAQSPNPMATTTTQTSQLTAKIVAIDYGARTVTLQDQKGNTRTLQAGPDVTRFNALKVGDTITFTYTEAVAVAIVKGGASPMPAATSTPVVTRYPGEKPGGQIQQTMTASVTVQAIDPAKPSISVKTQNGNVLVFLVQDRNNLNGISVGDVVQITYTAGLMVTVK